MSIDRAHAMAARKMMERSMRRMTMMAAPVLPLGLGLGLGLSLSGCAVATLPFKATGKVVDWTTTSQGEADRNAGRAMRKAEARDGERADCDRDGRHCRDEDGRTIYFEPGRP
jgi:hypothetical protein